MQFTKSTMYLGLCQKQPKKYPKDSKDFKILSCISEITFKVFCVKVRLKLREKRIDNVCHNIYNQEKRFTSLYIVQRKRRLLSTQM